MSKRRFRATGTPLSKALAPNDLWCADFKGEFKMAVKAISSRVVSRASHMSRKREAWSVTVRG